MVHLDRKHLEMLVRRASEKYNLPLVLIRTSKGTFAGVAIEKLMESMLPHLLREDQGEAPPTHNFVELLQAHPGGLTNREIATHFSGLDAARIRQHLKELIGAGKVWTKGRTVGMRYFVR